MPERNVTLSVIISEFKPEEYPINAPVSQEYTVAVAKTAVAGEVVDVEIVVTNGMFAVSACLFNDKPCELVSSGAVSWKYRFTMPAEEVNLIVAINLDKHTISLKQGEHTTLRMLNCCEDWDAEIKVFEESMYGVVKFMWSADLGYDGQVKITGQTTGQNIEYSYGDDPDLGECWKCVMPDEPILIETSAVEKTDYLGKPFVGKYKGFLLTASEATQVTQSNSPVFSVELRSNTSYLVKSEDTNSFDFDGCYKFDEGRNTFGYLEEFSDDGYGNMDFGVSGSWFTSGDALVYISNLKDDTPENVRYYFASTSDFKFVSASSDKYGSTYLVELDKSNKKTWYYIERQTRMARPVTLEFDKGTSIGEKSEAIVSDETSPLFRYSYDPETRIPHFTMCGKEAGTYRSDSDNDQDPALTLDGFGKAVYGDTEGTYTLQGSVVTFTADQQQCEFAIDMQRMIYSMISSGEWNGPKVFSTSFEKDSQIAFCGNKETKGSMEISLDSDYSGNEKIGYAKFTASVWDSGKFRYVDVTAGTCVYTYNPGTQSILISQVLVGTADGRSTEHIDLRFKVSEDKETLTFEEDTLLRATSGGNMTYIKLKGLQLKKSEQ